MKRSLRTPPSRLSITPLIDIAFLVLIFFMALPLKRLDAKLAAHLPTGRGINDNYVQPRDVIHIRVRDHNYQLGDHEAETPWELAPVLRRLGPQNAYNLQARPTVGWKRIVAMVNVLAGLKYPYIEFYGTPLPSREVRRARPLPMPAH